MVAISLNIPFDSLFSCAVASAVALNNIAVFLVEKGSYQQATLTLTDSIGLLRQASRLETDHFRSEIALEQITERYHEACRRLAAPNPAVTSFTGSRCEVGNLEEAPLTTHPLCASGSRPHKSSMLLRMETCSDCNVVSSVVLYNFGKVYTCWAAGDVTNTEYRMLRRKGGDLMHLALVMLQNKTDEDDDLDDEDSVYDMGLCSLTLSALILRELAEVSDLEGLPAMANKCRSSLLQIASEIQRVRSITGNCPTAAAAA